jgi:hypothetical protein
MLLQNTGPKPWRLPDPGFGTPGSGTVGEYDATTGAAINANFITGLRGDQRKAGLKSRNFGRSGLFQKG